MVIISGASRGIGLFLMEHFVNQNIEVLGLYNHTQPIAHIGLMHKVDITNPNEIEQFIAKQDIALNNIALINCAGTNYNAFAHKADLLKWRNLITVNLVGTFNLISSVLPKMREQNFGRIINFSSVVAQKGIPGTSAYAASKSGLWGMSRAIAVENASKGITINNLNLGYFQIGMIDDVPAEMQEIIKMNIPTKEFGNPLEIIKAVSYLMDAKYITGTSLDLNGGFI